MKHNYKPIFGFLGRVSLLVLLLLAGSYTTAKACHGVALVGLTSSVNGNNLDIDASSDASTCGCGPYWMQVEVACSPSTFTGAPPVSNSATWGTFPWYHDTLNIPNNLLDDCVVEPYMTVEIDMTQLCPGTTYYWRAREYVEGSASAGPWSAAASFTTPGSPPVTTLVATASQYEACPGDNIQLNASITGGCPGSFFSYSWQPTTGLSDPTIANPVLTVQNSSTVYTVTVTGGCVTITSADDTVSIVNGPPPIPGTPTANPSSVCSGGSSVLTVSGQDPSSLVQWQISTNGVNWFNISGANSSTYNTGPLTSSLYYQVIITGSGWPGGSGCGSTTSPPVLVTVNPAPAADAGANTTICNGGCTILTGSGGVSYDWQPVNQSTQSINVCPTSTTTYTLTVTDANGCTGTDQVTVNTSNATVTASPDVSICSGNNTILVAAGSSGSTYSWSPTTALSNPNAANPTASPTVTTNYTVTATNAAGCTAIDSVLVTVTAAPPLTVSNDTTLCSGGAATLTASGATSFSWSPGNQTGSSIVVSPTSTTTYVVTGNTSNCISYDTIVVGITPATPVYAGPDLSICNGTQATLNVGASGTYNWQPTTGIVGSNTQQNIVIDPTSNTSYTITVTDANGCVSSDTINVMVNQVPTVSATASSSSICVGQSTSLSASGATSYSWIPSVAVQNPNQSPTNATPSNTTTYQVVGTDANGCSDTASVTISVNPQPAVYLTSTASECGDTTGTIQFGGVVAGTGPFTYQVGSQTYTSLPITSLGSGAYTVITTDANGCTSTQVVTVGQQNTAYVNATATPPFGVYPLGVGFSESGTTGLNNFQWSFGDNGATSTSQSPSYTYTQPGTYTVVLVAWNDDPACAVYDTIDVNVVEQAIIALPNVFTPNSDGVNDDFDASVSGVQDIDVEIHDRWGNRVYEGSVNGLAAGPQTIALWDGKNKGGNVVADGVYYYIVKANGYDKQQYVFTGFVHLLQNKP